MGQDFSQDRVSADFSVLTQWCQQAMYPGEKLPRGSSVEFCNQEPGQSLRAYSTQAGVWLRVDSWLNAVTKAGVKVSDKTCRAVVEQLQFGEVPQEASEVHRVEILAHLAGESTLSKDKEEFFRGLIKQAQSDHLVQDKEKYQKWLEGAAVKGMRPLYRTIRTHEQTLVRPFRDKEAALRP